MTANKATPEELEDLVADLMDFERRYRNAHHGDLADTLKAAADLIESLQKALDAQA